MKQLIEVLDYIEFKDYMSEVKRFSYEITKKGLIISAADLKIRLLIDLKNLRMKNYKLKIFDEDFITVIDDFNLNQCNKYLLNTDTNNKQILFQEEQLNIF